MGDIKPLKGIRIAEMSSYLSGPYATAMLADMGALITKIEPPGGDPYRKFGLRHEGVGIIWQIVNAAKELRTIDLKSGEGLAQFLEIIKQNDVLVLNQRRSALERVGLTVDAIRQANPNVLIVYITGYGDQGPMSEQPAFDAILQGLTGSIYYQMPGQDTEASPYFLVDKITAVYVAQAIIAALYANSTGQTVREINLSMLHIATYFNFPDLMYQVAPIGYEKKWCAPQSVVFATADGHIVLSPVSGKQLSATLDSLGLSDHKSRLKDISDTNAMLAEFFRLVRDRLLTDSSQSWLTRLIENDVPCGPVLNAEQLMQHEQVKANGMIEIQESAWGELRKVAYPARFSE